MRNYTDKAREVRLPKEREKELREWCLRARGDDLELIRDVAFDATQDALSEWIVLSVTSVRWPWARLEANHRPCSQQTFRLYKMRFYYLLDKDLKMGHTKKTPRGGR